MIEEQSGVGRDMFRWATELWPVCRSITGEGLRTTLRYIQRELPGLELVEVPSGTKVFDWVVPDEWAIREAFIDDVSTGLRVVDFKENNLHVVGYSQPIDAILNREALEPHLYSLPDQPTAIPYVTSYYTPRWGFCLSQEQRDGLGPGPFHVRIDSDLSPGSLTYGELLIPGASHDEVLLSTYVCHPSMANNELSGPVVTTALAKWIQSEERRFTYRVVFAPETIGSITYLSRHLEHLRSKVRAGWVITCVGDERAYSFLPSRLGNTLADRVSRLVLSEEIDFHHEYSFLDRGSDERQWCSPGADLPVSSIMRSKYGTYPEYHTSLDDLSLISERGLQESFEILARCIEVVEANRRWACVFPGEPQLGRRGLYPTTSYKGSADGVKTMMDVLAYCDGRHDLIDLTDRTGASSAEVLETIRLLRLEGLILENDEVDLREAMNDFRATGVESAP
jgi:aminopeptidase-like protein